MIYTREVETMRKLRVEVVEAESPTEAYAATDATTIGSIAQRRDDERRVVAVRGPFKSIEAAVADRRRRGMRSKK